MLHRLVCYSPNKAFLHFALILITSLLVPHQSLADDLAEMQKKLNAETLDKPFATEDAAKVDSYIQDAMKHDLKPSAPAPRNWQPGYTCDSYYRRYSYSYYGYRDCMYHYRYYGRYW